jgi:hypothetical protein
VEDKTVQWYGDHSELKVWTDHVDYVDLKFERSLVLDPVAHLSDREVCRLVRQLVDWLMTIEERRVEACVSEARRVASLPPGRIEFQELIHQAARAEELMTSFEKNELERELLRNAEEAGDI